MLTILGLMPRLLRAFFWSLTSEKQLAWQHLWKTFEIVRFPAFCCFQLVVHMLSERKHCTLYLENICNLSCSKKQKSFLFKQLLSSCSNIYCNEVFWTYHPPSTCETHEAPFRPIPVCIQAQQKHQRCNTHSSAQCILKKQVHLSKLFSSTFLLPSLPYNHTWWQANFWNSVLTQNWLSGLLTFLSVVLQTFETQC